MEVDAIAPHMSDVYCMTPPLGNHNMKDYFIVTKYRKLESEKQTVKLPHRAKTKVRHYVCQKEGHMKRNCPMVKKRPGNS
uniref:CCHC-type domain-containing protein n=1 Tax=Lepeophtheirus salmonis TaxID=72036 RepID=A0A0K2TA13_LEPSM